MKTLYCSSIKNRGFSDRHYQSEWYQATAQVKQWQQEFGFEDGVRDLFYELLQLGYCRTVAVERISVISHVLNQKGYVVDAIK